MLGLTSILHEEDSCDNSMPLLTEIKEEAPYDSGYLSPGPTVQRPVRPTGQMALLSQARASPLKPRSVPVDPVVQNLQKPPAYENVGLSEEWEKDFFANFEENLFTLDLDDQVLDDILKSPKGKVALNEMINSPKGKAIMNSPKGNILKERMKMCDTPPNPDRYTTMLDRHGILGPESNKPGVTPMKPDAQRVLKMSKRKLSMGTINQPLKPLPVLCQTVSNITNENQPPAMWPSQERLKFARNNFKNILKRAVEKVEIAEAEVKATQNQKSAPAKTNRRHKGKSAIYPQLSKALSRPSISEPTDNLQLTRKSERKSQMMSAGMLLSGCQLQTDWYNPDEEDDDDDWCGDLPFTGFKQAVKRRKKPNTGQNKRRKSEHNSARYSKY